MQSTDGLKTLIKPTDWQWPDNDPLAPPQPPEPGVGLPGDDKKSDGGCGVLILAILLTITIIGLILYKLGTGLWPWQQPAQGDPGDLPPGSSVTALTAFVQSDDALMMVALFYHLHNDLYEAVSVGVGYLKRIGALYPDELDLPEPMFSQFTRLVTPGPETVHPRRQLSNPDIDQRGVA